METLVYGAGMMGKAAVYDAVKFGVDKVHIADCDYTRAVAVADFVDPNKVIPHKANATDFDGNVKLFKCKDAVLGCTTYQHNLEFALAAIAAGTNFSDLGGNNTVVQKQLKLDGQAQQAGSLIIPDTGYAPGMPSLIIADAVNHFGHLKSFSAREGGLPVIPKGFLNYMIVFSATGLVNEYIEPVIKITDGKREVVNPMEGYEFIDFPSPFGKMEAFNTSGGESTIPYTMIGKVNNFDNKTIRYLGHRDIVKNLLDFGMASDDLLKVDGKIVRPRGLLEKMLMEQCGYEGDDVSLSRWTAVSTVNGVDKERVYECIDYKDHTTGLTSMARMTAFSASIINLMMARGDIKQRGAIPQETCVPTQEFIKQFQARGINLTVEERLAK
ncbi:hypothetical protein COV93_07295 [Candidatus Woesearchaeota archaeon CG11_big_fil_rev_8_21_14_0_20_43_8]|nr:MAG: hypothetical protein COV93_07295 [Candidatus Woesearchaeota archaeon CG11_big_fil_rev_8_21_14_0_20_43_8]PIO08909.1 MAG: hypothetical protein COT47_00705 [Candidatus Woesearchaeota archaeon CG08_land_8_20_14_0_20_43_7]